jgi:S-DNA-T family DNA segregation ATPase FtsK/SpoIIIE
VKKRNKQTGFSFSFGQARFSKMGTAKIPTGSLKQPPNAEQPSGSGLITALNLLRRFQRFLRDIMGILLLALATMTLLALIAPELAGGAWLTGWNAFLNRWLGYGGIFMVLALGIIGLLFLRRQVRQPDQKTGLQPLPSSALAEEFRPPIPWLRLFSLEAAAFALLAFLAAVGGNSLQRAESGLDGGRIGWGLSELVRSVFSPFGLGGRFWQILFFGVLCLACLLYGFRLVPAIQEMAAKRASRHRTSALPENEPAVLVVPKEGAESGVPGSALSRRKTPLPAEFRKKFRMPVVEEKTSPPPPRDERLPPLEILVTEQVFRPDERNINQTAGQIEKTLAEFGIPAKVIGFRVGPTVTQFAIEPGFMEKAGSEEDVTKQKVRVAQIASLRRDLALALSAERLRIEAPVPGRPYLGIEVPNVRTSIVRLRPILEMETFYKIGSPLAIVLGRDVSGNPVVADLASMPHLLIGGTTGSGKSICIAALTTCLVMNNTPAELRLVMIDPKMVELVRFNGLPHLYGKVETRIERIEGVLRWVVAEMDRRYKLLEEMRARHIDSYNRKIHRRKGYEPLPRIVVMVDELADLMMTAPEQTEHTLVRLAQLARATGIHLVVATQRPSVEVVTGLIKANFPARISFAVASSVDSRVILDTIGAESLLGHGDMLFLPPDAPSPLRCQGVMVSDQEVEKVITFWQQSHGSEEEGPSPWEALLAEEEVMADKDNLVEKAMAVIRETQKASTSLLQRRLRIGYPRAARLMDELEELGIVGPTLGGGREREVLIGPEESDEKS